MLSNVTCVGVKQAQKRAYRDTIIILDLNHCLDTKFHWSVERWYRTWFDKKSHLADHLNSHGSDKELLQYDHCPKTFIMEGNLENHENENHSDIKVQ